MSKSWAASFSTIARPTRFEPPVTNATRLIGLAMSRYVPETGARSQQMVGILVQVNVSNGGMPKLAVPAARVTRFGVEGDRQRNHKHHGGPNRAVCLFSEELYDRLRDKGVDLTNGSAGENFTTRGLDLNALNKGDRLW